MDFLTSFWIDSLFPVLDRLWNSIVLWRTVGLAAVGLTLLAVLFRGTIKSVLFKREGLSHDMDIFKRSHKILEEPHLQFILDKLHTDDSCLTEDMRTIENFYYFFQDSSNQYLHKLLQKSLEGTLQAIDDLRKYIAQNFFIYPKKQRNKENLMLCLQPGLNPDREGTGKRDDTNRYKKFQKELSDKIRNVRKSYKQYRKLVKHILYV